MTLPLWPVFDGHNDLLLNLWLQHDDDPATAFYSRVTPGHPDFARMRRGGFSADCSRYLFPGQLYRPDAPPNAGRGAGHLRSAGDRRTANRHPAAAGASFQGQLRICRTATEIEQCRLNRQIAAVLHIEGAGMIDAELTQRRPSTGWACAASGHSEFCRTWHRRQRAVPGSPIPAPA